MSLREGHKKKTPPKSYDGAFLTGGVFLLEEPWRLAEPSHGQSFLANQVSASKEETLRHEQPGFELRTGHAGTGLLQGRSGREIAKAPAARPLL